jgi:hypothetical protein
MPGKIWVGVGFHQLFFHGKVMLEMTDQFGQELADLFGHLALHGHGMKVIEK